MKKVLIKSGFIALMAALALLAGCLSYSVESVEVTIDGNATSIDAGKTIQFNFLVTATGKDTSQAQRVNWSVSSTSDGAGPVTPGTSISPSGTLAVSADEIYPVLYVRATHAAVRSKYDFKQIQVKGPKVGSVVLSVSGDGSAVAGGTAKLSAFVAGQAPNQGLTYSVGSASGGTGAVAAGTAIAGDGTLTVSANETASSLYVKAVSNSDPTKFDIKEIKVVTVTSVTVSAEGGTARVLRGGRLNFSAAVAGNNNPGQSVTWKVSSNAAGTGTVTDGTLITGNGTLTVAAAETASTLYVTATSSVNTTKSGSITVTIPTVTSVSVAPANPQIKRGEGATFTARVQGTGNPGQEVTWKLDGIGGTTVTTITSNGMVIVNTAETLSQLLITATSVDDPAKFGTTMVTIPAVPAAVVPATPAPQVQATTPQTQTSVSGPAASAIELTAFKWVDANFTAGNQEHWFKFTAQATSHYIQFMPNTMHSVGAQLYASNATTASGAAIAFTNATTNANRTGLTVGAVYYIKVTPASASAGAYRIGFNTESTPNAITITLPTTGVTTLSANTWTDSNLSANNEQWFKFTSTSTTQYIHNRPGTLNSVINTSVFDVRGMPMGTVRATGGGANTYTLRTGLSNNTEYYVLVYAANSGTLKIGVNASSTPPAITLPTTGITDLAADTWANATMPSTPGAEQWYRFTTPAVTTIAIHFRPDSLNDAYIQLYNASGASAPPTHQSTLNYRDPSTTRTVTGNTVYYLRVIPTLTTNASARTGTYKIGVNTTASSSPKELNVPTTGVTDLTAGSWANGNITASGGEQWFRFTSTAETQFIHFLPGALTAMYVQMFTSDGRQYYGRSELSTNGSRSAERRVSNNTVYYVRVKGYTGMGAYRLAFAATSTAPAN